MNFRAILWLCRLQVLVYAKPLEKRRQFCGIHADDMLFLWSAQVKNCENAFTWSSYLPFGNDKISTRKSSSHGACCGIQTYPCSSLAEWAARRMIRQTGG